MPKLLLTLISMFAMLVLLNLCAGFSLQTIPQHRLLVGNTVYLAQTMPLSQWGFSYSPYGKCTVSIARVGCIAVETEPKSTVVCF